VVVIAVAVAILAIWLYLFVGRGGFWRASEREDGEALPAPAQWPAVAAIVPARDEAASIGATVAALLRQDYPGLAVIVVDDDSGDGTAALAEAAAEAAAASGRLTVARGAPLPAGWTGKLWALSQGADMACRRAEPPTYFWFIDADIAADRQCLRRLVARAEAGRYALVSVMAKLNCQSLAERLLIPAFVYFFQMLYPFAWVNRPDRAVAAGAGGCMLVRRDALARAGGIAAVRGALIDDCALARRLKAVGPIWLGSSDAVRSIRSYRDLGALGGMVVRSAYAELDYSPPRLVAALLGMTATFLAPFALLFFGGGAAALGLAACALMLVSYQPMLKLYGLSPLWALALPLIASVYMGWTVESALRYQRGQGGYWKGRAQALPRSLR
jgi:hopene-associated glycosyltransferase HpnB